MGSNSAERPIGRVALYARVSTADKQDPELQLRELRDYTERRGWALADEYVDHGVSGSRESRPALNRLMNDARQRKFDAVLVWKLDRFGRSLRHLANALADLEGYGVAFVSLRDNLDLSTASGRLPKTDSCRNGHSRTVTVDQLGTLDHWLDAAGEELSVAV